MAAADALVVGAGPAGSLAALILARAGVTVRLLDRAEFPRDKLCGDTLNPGSMAILDRLSAVAGPDAPPGHGASLAARIRACSLALTGMTVTGPGGACVGADYPRGLTGQALTRRDMDLLFVEAAAAEGVQVETGVTVVRPRLSDDGSRVTGVYARAGRQEAMIPARIVIAADGRGSRLASAMHLSRFASRPRRWAYGAYFAGVAGVGTRGEMHLRRDGYIGVAPLPGGLTNVCVVREQPRGDQRQVIRHAIEGDATLRDRFSGATMVSATMVLGPLAIDASSAGCPGLLLAGDAAGFVDPMTGDGLRFALTGAELAARAALGELASGTPGWRRLGTDRAGAFAVKWRLNRTLRSVVSSRRALGAAAALARRWPASVEYLIGVAGDVSLVAR